MILYVYNLALLVLLVAGLPWWVFRVLFTRNIAKAYGPGWVLCRGACAEPPMRAPRSGCTQFQWARCWLSPALWLNSIALFPDIAC